MSRYQKLLLGNGGEVYPTGKSENTPILTETSLSGVDDSIPKSLQEYRKTYENDPRPDLQDDHELWVYTLKNAKEKYHETYGVLHGLRCCGAKLEETKLSLKLLPGNISATDWDAWKPKWLAPIREKLKELFEFASSDKFADKVFPPGAVGKRVEKTEQASIFKDGSVNPNG
ncbi:MAG: hypothetical protein ACYDG6_06860 [Thermincolia bacterium]